MRATILRTLVLASILAGAGAAAAADLPRRHHHSHRDRVAYVPQRPAPALAYVPPYQVTYRAPDDACAINDFCTAAFGL